MDGAGAMTAEALRAEIAATRRRQQAAEGRGQELDAELRQAVERQMLRQELEAARSELAEQEAANRIKAELKQDVDMDRNSLALEPFRSRSASQTSGGRLYATGGESKSFGNRVARGEFVWELRQFSWLPSALLQRDCLRYTRSQIFEVGGYEFSFLYHPEGGQVSLSPAQHGTLAIFTAEKARILVRYRVFVKARGGDFVQWGETRDEIHTSGRNNFGTAYGPDVHLALEGKPPPAKGIFGLSHEQLLHSKWVENDSLTVKFVLEVRPNECHDSKPLLDSVKVPAPSLGSDTGALLQNGKGSDVRFTVQGEVIPAHSQVLCARSDVFQKQLTVGMQESVAKEIVIEDCDAATFKAFLKFLYTDSLPSVEELSAPASSATEDRKPSSVQLWTMQALLAVSHKYQMTRLQRWCEKQLSERLSTSEVCSILQQAHLLSAEPLERACLSYLKAHMAEVAKLPAYDELYKAWPQIGQKISFFMMGIAPIRAEDAPASDAERKRKRDDTGA